MEIWKLLAVIINLLALAHSVQGLSFTLDKEHWISENWQDEPFEEQLANQVESLIKRSKSQQFYGLMGKRSEVSQPVQVDRRRNKGGMFVGLMGRRSLRDTFTRLNPTERGTAPDAAEEPGKRSDLQEKWSKLQYY
ncbi:protachykinin-1 [Chanos chanos]|uniref:Protachykinin-1 n=1 Tax=Chanos chanos TaxID=29144 RepID=A0A6J2VB97_CHACN|nr:protachykinin-1-like [Chanos chanos]